MTILRYDDYETSSGRATYDADVVIVGTGAGGAAAGAELAEAGVGHGGMWIGGAPDAHDLDREA